jgi:hypothetical protein
VTALATTPVKGLRLVQRDAVALEPAGVPGNRAFYLIDDRARLVNGKLVGVLAAVVADYEAGRAGDDAGESRDEAGEAGDGGGEAGEGRLTLTFPDGTIVSGAVGLGATVQTRFFSRRPTARLVEGAWSDAISEFAGRPLRLVMADPQTGGVDRGRGGVVSLISTASVARLERVADGREVDPRRFRMLIEVAGPVAHEEDRWVGRNVRIGTAVVAVRGHVGRCLVTSQDPDTGIVDLPTLDLLAYRRGLPTTEPLAFGVYGEVLDPGRVAIGDAVDLV